MGGFVGYKETTPEMNGSNVVRNGEDDTIDENIGDDGGNSNHSNVVDDVEKPKDISIHKCFGDDADNCNADKDDCISDASSEDDISEDDNIQDDCISEAGSDDGVVPDFLLDICNDFHDCHTITQKTIKNYIMQKVNTAFERKRSQTIRDSVLYGQTTNQHNEDSLLSSFYLQRVAKYFDQDIYYGTVTTSKPFKSEEGILLWHVQYDDEDSEDLNKEELIQAIELFKSKFV